MSNTYPFSTTSLPDGIVIGGPWPYTIITWPGSNGIPKFRLATKPEYDLFQALEEQIARNILLQNALEDLKKNKVKDE